MADLTPADITALAERADYWKQEMLRSAEACAAVGEQNVADGNVTIARFCADVGVALRQWIEEREQHRREWDAAMVSAGFQLTELQERADKCLACNDELREECNRETRLLEAGWRFRLSPERWFRWYEPVSDRTVMHPNRAESARLAEEAMKNG